MLADQGLELVETVKLLPVDLEPVEGLLGHVLQLLEGVVEVAVVVAEEVVEEDAEGEGVVVVVEAAVEGVDDCKAFLDSNWISEAFGKAFGEGLYCIGSFIARLWREWLVRMV